MSYHELPLWRQFLLTCGDDLLGCTALLIYLCSLFEEISIRRRLRKFPPLLLLPPAMAAVNWGMMGMFQNVPLMCIIYATCILAFTLWSMWVWQHSFWQSLAVVCIAAMLQNTICLIFKYVLYAILPLEEMESANPGGLLLFFSLALPVHFAISILIRRLGGGGGKFCAFLEGNNHMRRTALLFAALEFVFLELNHMQYGVQQKHLAEYLVVTAALMALFTALVFHMAEVDRKKRQLQIQGDVIAWQQLHELSLEELRREIQTFRHDYKSLLVGLAGDEECGGLCRSLQELGEGFEERIGEKLQESAWISNLRIPQVRNLMLGKMAAMSQQGIECRLEVLYPMERVDMDGWDFVRCLGILVDNAMEAALETELPWVEILFLQENGSLMLRISNPWTEEIDRARLWDEGWSTKGKGRGLGLFSYRRILQGYPNVSHAASWDGGIFVQELTVEASYD